MLKTMRNLILLSFMLQVRSQLLSPGKCTPRPVIKGFDPSKYVGKWYEISRYEQSFTMGCDCVNVNYALVNGKVSVKNCCTRNIFPGCLGSSSCLDGTALISFPNQQPLEGKLNVTFFGPPAASNYWVYDTDYTTYAVVYNCEDLPTEMKRESLWILSRGPVLSMLVSSKVDAIIDDNFQKASLRITEQDKKKCNYD